MDHMARNNSGIKSVVSNLFYTMVHLKILYKAEGHSRKYEVELTKL